jgi:hypothetical protein
MRERERTVTYSAAVILFILIAIGLLGYGLPTSGQDSSPAGFLPLISFHPTRAYFFPAVANEPTYTPTPTPTPTVTPTPIPTATPTPGPGGPNLLPNPSFEEGWYHPNGIPELQIPNQWIFEWDEGYNALAPEHDFLRPEVRVMSRVFLPPHEHDLFIWDGDHTVKVFKGYGAVSFRFRTSVYLEPGRYLLEINVFPDLVVGYTSGGSKIWAPDPLSGEVRLGADGQRTGWVLPTFGQKNTIRHDFTVSQGKVVDVTAAFRGRWAILNNGWFMDDWRLTKLPS